MEHPDLSAIIGDAQSDYFREGGKNFGEVLRVLAKAHDEGHLAVLVFDHRLTVSSDVPHRFEVQFVYNWVG